VGTRTPYGVCRNPFHADYISGGSSSGSAAAVAAGLVSFALGTDTAGSGRVPAAFTNIVGLKPSCGRLSTRGVVPAVRSLDCVSIFALSSTEAQQVLAVAGQFDCQDPFAKPLPPQSLPSLKKLRVGVPQASQLNFFGNAEAEANYHAALRQLKNMGAAISTIDFEPFHKTALMLYEGSWVAERTAAVGEFINSQPESDTNPVVRAIIQGGYKYSAIDAYRDHYRLLEYRRQAAATWQDVDILALPTTGTIYTIAEVMQKPMELNRNLGLYTNFVNLMDLSAIALPSGFQTNGLPTGITLMARSGYDEALCQLGQEFQQQMNLPIGALHLEHLY
jgi:allophanate hydrolase